MIPPPTKKPARSPAGPPARALRTDVRVEFDEATGTALLRGPVTSLALRPVRGPLRTVLDRLAGGPLLQEELYEGLDAAERERADALLARAAHLLAHSVLTHDQRPLRRELVRLEPTARDAGHRITAVPADARVRLSRFAFCRSRDGVLVLESPLVKFRAVLTDRAARELTAALGQPGPAVRAGEVTGLSEAETLDVLGHLVGLGFAELAGPDGTFASDAEPELRQWDFHDLLFHSRVRSGRYDEAFGAVYPYRGEIAPRPAVKPAPEGPAVELFRPRRADLEARDPSLTTAVETRRSHRAFGRRALTGRELGEFLYRVQRVRVHHTPGPEDPDRDEVVSRPYPSGGSLYELELYVTVLRCEGIAPGIYHYDSYAHRLVLVNGAEEDRRSLLGVASRSVGSEVHPDVLFTVTSRFQRMAWKYRAMAYATTLRHTGVLYQTMYLVATAMALAPCGLGNGDADLSARVLGLDYLQESSVGDFLLGTPEPDAGIPQDPGREWHMVNSPEWALPDSGSRGGPRSEETSFGA
ncbi:SagB family peptide dehydrogenase [Streptomyces sp. AC627_RSS907]|uniref:SagB/ThcOx family dehydrogenase n=1 Tax=Streptomyces sp. AC627_RSS907 TaxID=2823684 RepID=UPI001C247F89|nr:SagB family peptide dehydrogenase [Streptomyces sp. AC627_RSS907]